MLTDYITYQEFIKTDIGLKPKTQYIGVGMESPILLKRKVLAPAFGGLCLENKAVKMLELWKNYHLLDFSHQYLRCIAYNKITEKEGKIRRKLSDLKVRS